MPSSFENHEVEETLDSQTIALRWIAGLMIAGAAWLLAPILVPFVMGLVLAIAVSPLARRLEGLGLGRTSSSLTCLVLVVAVLLGTVGLLTYQAGTILQHSDQYLQRIGHLLATATKHAGGERLLVSLGATDPQNNDSAAAGDKDRKPPGAQTAMPPLGAAASAVPSVAGAGLAPESASEPLSSGDPGEEKGVGDPEQFWQKFLRDNLHVVGGWLIERIGGFVGLLGSAVIFLSFFFYLLQTRTEWIERLTRVFAFVGLRPRAEGLERVQEGITAFSGFVCLVSLAGAVVIGVSAWLLGLPQPFLWGVIFGLLEFIPYFGPMVGGSLLTLVAATTGWWQPLAMLAIILIWLTLEGYVITPLIYGRAVRFDPVMVLVAILFFGWLWGPFGMVTALPVMVILRELVEMTPETPALDALMEPEAEPVSEAAVR